jgi:hypothetical protein
MERRKAFAAEHGIGKVDYATLSSPFSGRVIFGKCGKAYGRKVWNSTDDRLRRVILRCNGKYEVKGNKACESKHIDDRVLYQAFINAFNVVIGNKDYFMQKWQQVLESEDDILKGVIAKRFEVDLYFKIVEKIVGYDKCRSHCRKTKKIHNMY